MGVPDRTVALLDNGSHLPSESQLSSTHRATPAGSSPASDHFISITTHFCCTKAPSQAPVLTLSPERKINLVGCPGVPRAISRLN
ncbi:hypothetical protein PROFUN_02134 [Planoprotostelium fungivorum]|uniref:Uncharacterized protein n=1 Tax=Planoprotostelium fungivorum TaxID=1890364 RepID=A0A2P6NZ89_9EUKA|nr:hypothetical protein PROFUN_02134 [Planoprotostelium fungivorum]